MSMQEASLAHKARAQAFLGDKFSMLQNAIDDLDRQGLPGKALHAGQHAPHFTLPDAFGKQVEFAEILKHGPAVVLFYRGEWCPFCNIEVHAFQQLIPEFEKHHATLIAISPEKPEHGQALAEKHQLTFPVLSDAGNSVARQFGLVFSQPEEIVKLSRDTFKNDLGARNADGSWDLPMPGTFVIDQAGTIRFAHVNANYMTNRATPEQVLAALSSL